jgi:hypothetical protein
MNVAEHACHPEHLVRPREANCYYYYTTRGGTGDPSPGDYHGQAGPLMSPRAVCFLPYVLTVRICVSVLSRSFLGRLITTNHKSIQSKGLTSSNPSGPLETPLSISHVLADLSTTVAFPTA